MGPLASDKLSGMLQDSDQKSNRYSLVDRQGLKKILEERDLQMAFSDPEQAARHAGKLKAVDAIIYGSILTTHEQVRTSKMSFDFSTQRPKTIYYNKLCCSVTVNFRMVDVTNGTMLATRPVTKAFDSDKDAKQSLFAKLMGKQDTPPDDQVLGTLIDKAVADFVAYISPREETVNARLAAVRSPRAGGNTLAQTATTTAHCRSTSPASPRSPMTTAHVQRRPDVQGQARLRQRREVLRAGAANSRRSPLRPGLARVHGTKEEVH